MKKDTKLLPWYLIAAVAVSIMALTGCQSKTKKATPVKTPVPATPTMISTTQVGGQAPVVLAGAITTQDGLQYLHEVAGDGPSPKVGDVVVMNYKVSLPDGTVLYDTFKYNQTSTAVWGHHQLLPGWEEGVGLMKQGGRAKFVLPPELAFGAQGNASVPPNSQIIMEVELVSVKPAPIPVSVTPDQLKTMNSGVQYYDISVGDGTEAISGTTVTTEYTIWVSGATSDEFIVSSETSEPATFVVGHGNKVFAGWEQGVIGMKAGGERLLIIPPELAMGAPGSGLIPSNATLIMQIKLASVQMLRTATSINPHDYVRLPYSLMYYDLQEGTGITPTVGSTVVMNYVGWLLDGTQFDSSYDRGKPFTYVYGKGNVIMGWDMGIASMKVGGKRQIVIPAMLAYGETGMGGSLTIPPDSVLILEVELIDVKP